MSHAYNKSIEITLFPVTGKKLNKAKTCKLTYFCADTSTMKGFTGIRKTSPQSTEIKIFHGKWKLINLKLTNKAPNCYCIYVSVNKAHNTDILSCFVSKHTSRQM